MQLSIHNSDQAIAAIPHLLGFEPEESLVVVPVSGGRAPLARLDLPKSPDEEREVIDTLTETYGSRRWGDVAVVLACFSEKPEATRGFSANLEKEMERRDVPVVSRIAANRSDWIDFTAGGRGSRTSEAKNLIDAEVAFAGRRVPLGSRAELAAEFVGNSDPIADELLAARIGRDQSTRELQRRYCQAVVEQYQCDRQRLNLGDSARLLVNLEIDVSLFIQMAGQIRTDNAVDWLPLWKDLTRHAPDEVRTEPACLAALAAWCAGDGASAWSALDRLPADMPSDHQVAPVAELLRQSLRTAAHPRTWDQICQKALTNAEPSGAATPSSPHRTSASRPRRGGGTPGLAI